LVFIDRGALLPILEPTGSGLLNIHSYYAVSGESSHFHYRSPSLELR